ncbi:uncharacterized protein [Gossypium hirsutum]|uniref:Uncharacterized protein n=1 Tax=Gossypium hirsutum TaxID=3635 RepID=A0A1U8PJK0_GOSHI|nr:uncharacterized protein LOC107958974 [Gossypium hirsutum]
MATQDQLEDITVEIRLYIKYLNQVFISPSYSKMSTGENKLMQLNELDKWGTYAYENSRLYKEAKKRRHDARLKQNKQFEVGDLVLLYNSRLKLFSGKHKSRWSGPFVVKTVFPYGIVEISHPSQGTFKVNGHRLKPYNSEKFKDDREELRLHESP